MANTEQRHLGEQMLRGVCLFQIIVAIPVMFLLGICAFERLFYDSDLYYYFFADSITAIMTAGIVFIVYVQRRAILSVYQNLLFEASKAVLATALWLWLILDTAFGPWRRQRNFTPAEITLAVKKAALCVLLLLVLFYPPTVFMYLVRRKEQQSEGNVRVQDEETLDRGEEGERTPLLSG